MVKRNQRIIKRNNFPMPKFPFPIKNVGGHLPNPPEDCERKDKWSKRHSIIWIDLSLCHSCSILKECHTRKTYLKAVKQQGIPS